MKRADDLTARLEFVFAPPEGKARPFNLVTGPGEVFVDEKDLPGRARIGCRFGEGMLVIQWHLQDGDLRLIGGKKNADGAILVVRPDGALEAHVMECKQTVNSGKWGDVLQQFGWTVIRLLAIAGALHERVERVVLYTAFKTNALAAEQSANPEEFRIPLEGEDGAFYRRDWPMMQSAVETEVELRGWTSRFLHVKVPKDEQGHATVELRIGP